MIRVSPELYDVLSLAARYLFALTALFCLLYAFRAHHADRAEEKKTMKNLPGAGTVGELVVLSGVEGMDPETWQPVPREGVLGALRSCDLVIPAPGVRKQHLDFFWQDGAGLRLALRSGCTAMIDGRPVDCRSGEEDTLLRHGSILQVGASMLRFQAFTALVPAADAVSASPVRNRWFPDAGEAPSEVPLYPGPYQAFPRELPSREEDPSQSAFPDEEAEGPRPSPPVPSAARRPKSDRWKEDFGE